MNVQTLNKDIRQTFCSDVPNYFPSRVDMVLSGQCRQDSKFLETVTVATVRLETVRQ